MKRTLSLALLLAAALFADDAPRHATLGAATRVPNTSEREALKLVEGPGVLVEAAEGPAAAAGLRPGDAILSIGGRAVHNDDTLQDVVRATPPGTELELGVRRKGTEQTLRVTLGSKEGPAWPGIEWTHVGAEGLKEALEEAKESGKRVLVGLSGSEAC